jgi:hypothetical protein
LKGKNEKQSTTWEALYGQYKSLAAVNPAGQETHVQVVGAVYAGGAVKTRERKNVIKER